MGFCFKAEAGEKAKGSGRLGSLSDRIIFFIKTKFGIASVTLHTLFVVVLCAYFPALSILPYCESVHPSDNLRGIGP